MLEQVSTTVKFLAFFTATKQGKTGLTVTVDIYDPSGSQIVTDGSASALGGGLYYYELSSNNSSTGEYAAIFKTADSTVDAQHIPSLWVLGRAGVENLDAATSTRATSADIPTAIDIRTELDTNSTKLANLDATVSSRLAAASYTAPTTPPTAAAIADEVRVELTAELANLDAPVSGATAPTASTVATAVRSELATELAHLDADISTRAVPADIPSSDISAIKTKTDALNTDRLGQCSTVATTGAQLAAALS